jgi:UDP-2,3-diacylglucosamine pyrophosphatase LpxH
MKKDYIRLIISDLHLGSHNSKEKEILELLKNKEFDELILAGDVIDFIKIPTFTKITHSIFNYIISNNIKVIYIIGNHDNSFDSFDDKLLGNVHFMESYNFNYSGRSYHIEHGHKLDSGIVGMHFLIKFVSIIQDFFERKFNIELSRFIKLFTTSKKRVKRIWNFLHKSKCDVFIVGHTHFPEALVWIDENQNIKTYINTGDWVEHSTYVEIKDGLARLKKWNQKSLP